MPRSATSKRRLSKNQRIEIRARIDLFRGMSAFAGHSGACPGGPRSGASGAVGVPAHIAHQVLVAIRHVPQEKLQPLGPGHHLEVSSSDRGASSSDRSPCRCRRHRPSSRSWRGFGVRCSGSSSGKASFPKICAASSWAGAIGAFQCTTRCGSARAMARVEGSSPATCSGRRWRSSRPSGTAGSGANVTGRLRTTAANKNPGTLSSPGFRCMAWR